MKLLLLLAACCAYAQSVTAVKLAEAGHATAQIIFQSSDPGSTNWLRMRVASSGADCRDGASGYAQRTAWEGISGGGAFPDAGPYPGWSYAQVGGLLPNTTYTVCPEISRDGQAWSGGRGISLTTKPLPPEHPEPPIRPALWDSSLPDTRDYPVKTYADGADCQAHLEADIDSAYAQLTQHGQVLKLPHYAGNDANVCEVKINLLIPPDGQPSDVHRFTAADVNTATNQLHLAAHGLHENDTIKIGAYEACLPNSRYSPGDCHSQANQAYGAWGICQGCLYRVHVIDADHVQIYHPAGHLVTYNGGAGNGVGNCSAASPCVWMQWPRRLHSIVICTDASTCGNGPETTFAPTGTRLQGASRRSFTATAPVPWQPATPLDWWGDQLAVIQMPLTYSDHTGDWYVLKDNGDGINRYSFFSHVYFVGIHFRYAPDPEQLANLTPWPVPKHQMFWSTPADDHWVFDRVWFDAGSSPEHHSKVGRMLLWDGSSMSIQNSYLDGMHYYHVASSTLAQDSTYMGGACNGACGIEFSAADGGPGYSIGAEGSRLAGGDTVATLTAPATITAQGNANGNDWAYFDMAGTMNIALPPGARDASCTGPKACRAYTLMDGAQGDSMVFHDSGGDAFPDVRPAAGYDYLVWVEPLVGTKDNPQGLFLHNSDPNVSHPEFGWDYPVERTYGFRFYSDEPTECVGVRFWKPESETASTHEVDVWNDSGAPALTHAASREESASGWQTVLFDHPLALDAKKFYRVSVHFKQSFWYSIWALRNHELFSLTSPLHVQGRYVPSNGRHDIHDNWPLDYRGSVAVLPNSGAVWTNGKVTNHWLAYVEGDGGGGTTSSEGSQCMVGGMGPGPYKFANNYLEGSGTCWHHDDSGGATYPRAGYEYVRNYILTPGWALIGHPENKGWRYYHRHVPEWKSGDNGEWIGNVTAGAWQEDTPIGDLGEWTTARVGSGMRDWLFRDNIFAHGGFAFSGPYIHPDAGPWAPYVTRIRFENNLVWDIAPSYCAHGWGGFCTSGNQAGGVVWDLNDSMEDWVARHNTIVYPSGSVPALLSIRSGQHELFLENNFLHVNVGSFRPGGGIRFVNGSVNDRGEACEAKAAGRAAFDCVSPHGSWKSNVLTSDGYTQQQLQTQWPQSFVPNTPDIGSSIGWMNFIAADTFNRYPLKANWMSGSASHATDGLDVGVNMHRLAAAVGYVQLGGILHVTDSSAEIHWTDYDGNSCQAVDVSTDPKFPIDKYKRTPITTPDVATVIGLAAHTTYQFRLLCAAMALTGRFQTQ
jgi:hypothetical protein